MADLAETAALVALLRSGRRPWREYAELVEAAGSANAVLASEHAADPGSEQPRLFSGEERPQPDLDAIQSELAAWADEGIQVLTVLDAGYPENLRGVHDRPPLVFLCGRLTAADARCVAVVGARAASADGLAIAALIARHLVTQGYTVASGLAAGIDTGAHRAAIEAGGRTMAVIGTGLRRAYPPENAALQQQIAADHAVMSQFWPDSPPSKRSFPMRNAVMSGISLANVIVEASHTSGARIQARLALEQGRPVFLWHTLLDQKWARDFARRPGAHVVRSPDEITAAVQRLTSTDTLVA
ncbi:MAG: DNA-processing protein DprA [Solirubrobacteraceae bacterium]